MFSTPSPALFTVRLLKFCTELLPGGGGTRKNFDSDARVTFLGLKFDNLLFLGVAQYEGYFWGVEN